MLSVNYKTTAEALSLQLFLEKRSLLKEQKLSDKALMLVDNALTPRKQDLISDDRQVLVKFLSHQIQKTLIQTMNQNAIKLAKLF